MTDPTYLYIDGDDYRAASQESALVDALDDEPLTGLILEAMTEIDAWLGEGWVRFDETQEFIFPRDQDTDADGTTILLPRPLQIATRKVCDAILRKRKGKILPHQVESETNLGHSYTRRRKTIEAEPGFEHWPEEVFGILQKFRKVGGSYAVSNPFVLGSQHAQ